MNLGADESQPIDIEVMNKRTADDCGEGSSKRKKKCFGGAAYVQKQNEEAADDTGKVISLLEQSLTANSNNAPAQKDPEFDLAIDAIYGMADLGMLKLCDDLWCYAIDLMNDDRTRRCFMALKSESDRLAWLKFRFNKLSDI